MTIKDELNWIYPRSARVSVDKPQRSTELSGDWEGSAAISLEQIDGLFQAETREHLPVCAPHPLQIKMEGMQMCPLLTHMSAQAKKEHIWQAFAEALSSNTYSISHLHARHGAKCISVPEAETNVQQGWDGHMCMCERSVSSCLYPEAARRAVTQWDVLTPPADVLHMFVKHERFRCETDVKVAEIKKALTCDCWQACLTDFINDVSVLHNWEKNHVLPTHSHLNDCLTSPALIPIGEGLVLEPNHLTSAIFQFGRV